MTQPWRIQGHWYAAGDSRQTDAQLRPGPLGRVQLDKDGQTQAELFEAEHLRVSSRLGNTPRYIRFPDDAILETRDNDAVDRMLRALGRRHGGVLHWLESHRLAVLVAVFVTIAFVWGSVRFGVPAVAERVAHTLPATTLDQIARETLVILDRTHFEPSGLGEARQAQLQALFDPVLAQFQGQRYRVLFREGGESVGANAMALPDGTLIFTDELVRLSRDDQELLAILAHEIGHVEHRHSLRALIQTSLLSVGAMALVGDASAFAEVLAGMPVVFASLSYSRAHELEADRFSAQWMDRHEVPRAAFVAIMERLNRWGACRALVEDASPTPEIDLAPEADWQAPCDALLAERDDGGSAPGFSHYLSTHPGMHERLERFHAH